MRNKKEKNSSENILITWHLPKRGICYILDILDAFYKHNTYLPKNISIKNAVDLQKVFDNVNTNGFKFDKIYYFYSSDASDDSDFDGNPNLSDIFKKIKEKVSELKDLKYETLIAILQKINPSNRSHYNELIRILIFNEQIKWLLEDSNFTKIYDKKQIEFIPISQDPRDITKIEELAKVMHEYITKIKKKHKNSNFIVNLNPNYAVLQTILFLFIQSGILPATTRFIVTDYKKEETSNKLEINEVQTNVINSIYQKKIRIYEETTSIERKIAELKFRHYLNQGFAILLIGERGIGKSHIAEKFSKEKNFVAVNCATFTDNTLAESILFGHIKGAFTDAKEDKPGVFEQANDGTLFLDEIHNLDKLIQAKLMKAIQTDENNYFRIRRLGDKKEIKVTCQLILATNRTIEELRECLLPDFYDRITQLVVEFPPLRRTPEEIWPAFKQIWTQLKFNNFFSFEDFVEKDEQLKKWLFSQPLYGNYRDLQRIAIYYKTFLAFGDEEKKLLLQKTPFEFAKANFEKYSSFKTQDNELFDLENSPFENVKLYQQKLAEAIIKEFGSLKKAEEFYKSKNIEINKKTLQNWLKNSSTEQTREWHQKVE